jgi:hypothetical protein
LLALGAIVTIGGPLVLGFDHNVSLLPTPVRLLPVRPFVDWPPIPTLPAAAPAPAVVEAIEPAVQPVVALVRPAPATPSVRTAVATPVSAPVPVPAPPAVVAPPAPPAPPGRIARPAPSVAKPRFNLKVNHRAAVRSLSARPKHAAVKTKVKAHHAPKPSPGRKLGHARRHP